MKQATYSQGVCMDGAAILRDGQMMTVDEIVAELNALAAQPVAVPDMSACFMTAESGGGEYKVVLRFQTLAKMQDAHSAMIHWLAAAPKPEQQEAPELTDDDICAAAGVKSLGPFALGMCRAVIAADRAKRAIK